MICKRPTLPKSASMLDWAMYYVEKGYSVIPLSGKVPDADVLPQEKNEKGEMKPTWKPYQQRRPGQEELLSWFGSGSKRNIGIVTGSISGLAVIDLDSKEAVQTAKDLNFPATPLVKTYKGFHAYYKYKDGIRNFQKRSDLPGIDLRGDGGYVCAPPSIHATGVQYSWEKSKGLDDIPLAEFPEIILAKTSNDKTPLKELYKGATEGNRNDTLTRLTGSWVNDGLSFEECLENARIWNSKNNPSLPDREVENTIKSIFGRHAKTKPTTMVLTRLGDLFQEAEETTTWLVEGLLPTGGLSIVVAKPKVGKTTLVKNICLDIAHNKPFLGRNVSKGPVVYIALEDKRSEVKRHFRAMGASGEEEIYIYVGGSPADAMKQITAIVKSLKPVILVIDPLFRLVKLKDGNDYIQVTNAMEPLLRLARDTETHVLCVHHSPKGEREPEDCALGSQAIFGSVDTLMLMKRHANYRTLQTIQRYGEDLIETILDYDKSTGRVTIGNTKQEREAHSIEEMLIDFLTNQTEPVTEKVIKDGIEGRNILKRRALQDLIKQQEIVKIGKGGRKDPYRYYYSQNVACSQHESLLQNLPQNEPSKDPEIEPKNLLQILLEKGHEKNHEQEPREQPNNDAKNSSSRVPTLGREQQNNNTKTAANSIGCSYGSVPVFGNFKPSRELQKLSGNLAEIRGKTLLEKVGITLSSKTTGKTTGITDDIPEVEFAEEVKTNV